MPRARVVPATVPTALPSETTLADLSAIKALTRGDATSDQQKRALDWIVRRLARIGEPSFHPGDSHAMAFKDGRKFVGQVLANIMTGHMDELRQQFGLPDERLTHRPQS